MYTKVKIHQRDVLSAKFLEIDSNSRKSQKDLSLLASMNSAAQRLFQKAKKELSSFRDSKIISLANALK